VPVIDHAKSASHLTGNAAASSASTTIPPGKRMTAGPREIAAGMKVTHFAVPFQPSRFRHQNSR
jgi:hypothetical protein